jgi:diguanylate cyclase (GGDEF)-like protein
VEAISKPVEVRGQFIIVRASVGVSVYPDDGLEVAQLIHSSDVAMYRAKKRGAGYEFFLQEDLLVRATL